MAIIGHILNRSIVYQNSDESLTFDLQGISFKKAKRILKKISRKFNLLESDLISDPNCEYSKIFILGDYFFCIESDRGRNLRITSTNKASNFVVEAIAAYIEDK